MADEHEELAGAPVTGDELEAADDADAGPTGPLPVTEATSVPEPVWADDEPGNEAADDVWAEDGDVDDDAAASAEPDPVVHALLVFAMAIVVTLVATTGVLYFYLSTLNKAPRTMAERDVAAAESLAAGNPKSSAAWAQLAYSYSNAGRTDDALGVLERAKGVENAESLAVVKADVLRLGGRHREAITEYDRALTATLKLKERIRRERAEIQITREITDDGALLQVYWGRALAKRELGQLDGAIADFELASLENSRQAEVWVQLGDLYVETGNPSKAEVAYRSALKFVPDLADALDGLKKMGKE